MQLETISFSGERQARLAMVQNVEELPGALDAMGLARPTPTIVLVGGAGAVSDLDKRACFEAVRAVVHTAEHLGAALVDGGTAAGIMDMSGQVRARRGFKLPLIGVAAQATVAEPDGTPKDGLLQPDHTHFIFTPGDDWGDEAPWIAATATALAVDKPSLTILVNGGDICRTQDLPNSLKHKRPIVVVQGTGRLADEIARSQPDLPLIQTTRIQDIKQTILNLLLK